MSYRRCRFLFEHLAVSMFFRNSAIKIAKILRLGKKKNKFFCFALVFS